MTRTASGRQGQPEILVRTTTASDELPSIGRYRWFSILRQGQKQASPKRIGLYGLFGCRNFGNDGLLEAMVIILRQVQPNAELICICAGPQIVTRDLRLPAISIGFPRPANAPLRALLAGPCKLGSFVRSIWYARTLGLLIVSGSGQLEDHDDRPFKVPLSLFAWCLAAKLAGTRIAFVSVGAGPAAHPISRWLFKSAAAMAEYRSYRDTVSKAFMESIGLDTRSDEVYPDLAFKLPVPPSTRERGTDNGPLTVGVGVMAYHGWLQRNTSAAVYTAYLETLTSFVLWLLDRGHLVRILTGDAIDRGAVDDLVTRVVAARPDLPSDRLLAAPSHSPHDVIRQTAETDAVVATRFHNAVYALRLGKPTVSIGYGEKHDALMTEMGLGSFCQNIRRLKLQLLIEQFTQLISDRQRYEQSIRHANLANRERLDRQASLLTARLP